MMSTTGAMQGPLVSIICATFNDSEKLAPTLINALSQVMASYEVLVVDGGSKDDTVELLASLQTQHECLSYVSEPDKGIYDALNKGVSLAKGKYLLVLNAGDTFSDNNALQRLSLAVTESNQPFIVARAKYYYPARKLYKQDSPSLPSPYTAEICHQAFLYQKDLHHRLGPYSLELKSAADYDFFMRLLKAGYKFEKINDTVVTRGKYGDDTSEQPLNTIEMIKVDFKNGVLKHTVTRRIKSLIIKCIRLWRKKLLCSFTTYHSTSIKT